MKKIFILFLSLMVSSPVFAKSTVIVQSLSNFSSMNPQYTISVKVAKTHKFKRALLLIQRLLKLPNQNAVKKTFI